MLWKIYFWLITIIVVIAVPFDILRGNVGITWGIDVLFSFIGLLSLYGYVYKKRFFQPLVWKLYFPLMFVYDLWYTVLDIESRSIFNISQTVKVTSYFMIILCNLPFYIALYKYAYKYDGEDAKPVSSPNDIPDKI